MTQTTLFSAIYRSFPNGERIFSQPDLLTTQEERDKLITDAELPVVVMIDTRRCIQHDITAPLGFEVAFFNVFSRCAIIKQVIPAQALLYKTREEALNVAFSWESHPHNSFFRSRDLAIYDHIAVPVVIPVIADSLSCGSAIQDLTSFQGEQRLVC